MNRRFSANWLPGFFGALLLVSFQARAEVDLPELSSLAAGGARVSAVFSVGGRRIASISPDSRLNPASVTKLFTAALALKILGPDHRVMTEVFRTRDGRIAIRGGGDPELRARDLGDLAACVASKAGRGPWSRVVFSTGPFDRQDLPPAYGQKKTSASYRAGVAGLQIDRNAFTVGLGRTKPGMVPRVTVTPDSDYFRVSNRAVASAAGKAGAAQRKKNPLSVEVSTSDDGRMLVSVDGVMRPEKGYGYTFRVDNPAWNAAAAFLSALAARKVKVREILPERGDVPVDAQRICFRPSRRLSEIIIPMLKDSINPVAESVLRLVGAAGSGRPVGFDEGAGRMRDFLVHDVLLPPESFVFANGSGLYGANSVSAGAVVGLVDWILATPAVRSHVKAAMAVGGVDGTLAGRFTSETLKGRVFAKTGTLDEAISLAGWVEMPDGRNLSFAVLVEGDSKLNAAGVRNAIDASVSRAVRSVSAP